MDNLYYETVQNLKSRIKLLNKTYSNMSVVFGQLEAFEDDPCFTFRMEIALKEIQKETGLINDQTWKLKTGMIAHITKFKYPAKIANSNRRNKVRQHLKKNLADSQLNCISGLVDLILKNSHFIKKANEI